jgi:hypothetical protein
MNIRNYLSQRYPLEENIWKIILPISVFISLFMMIFQPFGLDDLQMKFKGLMLAGYGLVTLLVLILDLIILPRLLPKQIRDDEWSVLKEMFFLLWILFTVGLGNFAYSSLVLGFTLSISNILVFQAYTIAVGIIPVTAVTLIKLNYLKRKNESTAEQISATLVPHAFNGLPGQEVCFLGENQKEELRVNTHDILFIRSEGNYITVGYLKNGKPAQVLLRNTMKYATGLLAAFPSHFQCHRSWMVNLDRIIGVRGNSQGLRVVIRDIGEDIPVARKNIPSFREKLAALKD